MPTPFPPAARHAAALVLAAGLAACAAEPPAPPPPPAVQLVSVSAAAGSALTFTGTTRAAVESRVSFQVGGTVVRTLVGVGDRVARGQLLAVLDPRDIEIQAQQARSGAALAASEVARAGSGVEAAEAGVAQAEAGLAQAHAGAALAEAEDRRIRALYAEDLVPLSAYDAVRTQAETARAAVRTAESGVRQARAGVRAARAGVATARAGADASQGGADLARRALAYTRIYAPVSGAVAGVFAEPGELVAPGQPVVLVTTQGGPMEVTVDVPESVVARLVPGASAVVQLSALPEEPFAATVAEVGVAPSPGSTTFPVVVRLARTDPRVRSGLSARVAFDAPGERPGLVVPPSAVSRDAAGAFVFVAAEAGPGGQAVVARRAVELGAVRPEGVTLVRGVAPGDRVVRAGGGDLSDGQAVRVLAADPLTTPRTSF